MSVHPEDMEDAMTFVRMITEDYVPKSDLLKLVERWLYDHSSTAGLDRHTINIVAKSFQKLTGGDAIEQDK